MATSRLGKLVVDLLDVTQMFQQASRDNHEDMNGVGEENAAYGKNLVSSTSQVDVVPALYAEPKLTGSLELHVDTMADRRLVDAGLPEAIAAADEEQRYTETHMDHVGANGNTVSAATTHTTDVRSADGISSVETISGNTGDGTSNGVADDVDADSTQSDNTSAARNVTVSGRKILDDVTWLIGPGDRFGIVGANGAGKSTLLKIIDGTLTPTAGRVNIGKTVKFAVLSQRLDELEKLNQYKIKEVLSRYKPSYIVDGKEVTPAQLMERLGFSSAQLMTPIRDLSGGQKRRMQLLLILLGEPNVLIMDEPGNDLDTDMLAVMEDLLDTWPGTLIVVSHDRYLLERVTDQQFALMNGKVRHLPGGVDDYLRMIEQAQQVGSPEAHQSANKNGAASSQRQAASSGVTTVDEDNVDARLTGKAFHDASKRVSAIERKLEGLEQDKTSLEKKMAAHDPSDFSGLAELNKQLTVLSEEVESLESEWMELSEQIE
jgi:ABC-type multidrug transport system ATPase subunit